MRKTFTEIVIQLLEDRMDDISEVVRVYDPKDSVEDSQDRASDHKARDPRGRRPSCCIWLNWTAKALRNETALYGRLISNVLWSLLVIRVELDNTHSCLGWSSDLQCPGSVK